MFVHDAFVALMTKEIKIMLKQIENGTTGSK